MKKLTELSSKVIYQKIYVPYAYANDRLELFFKNNIAQKENNLFLLLISVILCTIIIPCIIVFNEYELYDKVMYSMCYLLLFTISIFFVSTRSKLYDQINEEVSSKFLNQYFTDIALEDLKFRNETKLEVISSNMVLKRAFKCQPLDLIRVLSNEAPTKRIDITFIGGNGKISYHALFYMFHYLLEGGIGNLNKGSKNELFNYIIWNFTKDGKEITTQRIRQSYKDWLCQTNDIKFKEDFLNIFINKTQSVKDK